MLRLWSFRRVPPRFNNAHAVLPYDLLSVSLISREPEPFPSSQPEPVSPRVIATDRTFWPPERVDAIVDSISRMNRISLVPGMTVQRWLSVGVAVVYVVATIALLPRREINRVLEVSLYLLLPLSVIGEVRAKIVAVWRDGCVGSSDGCSWQRPQL
jgi:hypothetical protein